MHVLSSLLEKEDFLVRKISSQKNKIFRLLEMVWTVAFYKYNFLLIDTFSTSNFNYALITSQIARFRNKAYIPILRGGNLPQRLDHNPKLSSLIFKHTIANIAPSGYLKHEFEKRGYQTVYIPNILDLKDFSFKQRREIQPKLLWVRAFAQLYNPQMAIKTLKELQKNYPKAELCMVGPKKDESWEETHALVQSLGLESSVTFTGVMKREEWLKLSKDYDVFINTTTIDNTPVSVMEAMAVGLPVVSTYVGGVPYLVNNDVDGLLVNSNDVMAMSQAITDLLNHPDKVENLTFNARQKVEGFDWSVVKFQWQELLNKMLD